MTFSNIARNIAILSNSTIVNEGLASSYSTKVRDIDFLKHGHIISLSIIDTNTTRTYELKTPKFTYNSSSLIETINKLLHYTPTIKLL